MSVSNQEFSTHANLLFTDPSLKPKAGRENRTSSESIAASSTLAEPKAQASSHTAESGFGADPGEGHWKSCADEVGGFVLIFHTELMQRLTVIDKQIIEYGKLLNDSQPGATGKILVRWWKTGARGRVGGTTPVFVELSRNRAKRLTSRRIDSKNITKRAKSRSTFQINYRETIEILATLANLFEMRAKIFDDIGRLKRVLSAMRAKDSNLSFIAARGAILARQISENLYRSE